MLEGIKLQFGNSSIVVHQFLTTLKSKYNIINTRNNEHTWKCKEKTRKVNCPIWNGQNAVAGEIKVIVNARIKARNLSKGA